MDQLIGNNAKAHLEVKIIKNKEMTLFGISSYSSEEFLWRDMERLKKNYNEIAISGSKIRKTNITIIKSLGAGRYHLTAAGFVRNEKFCEYKTPASDYAMMTVRGYIKQRIRKNLVHIREYFFNTWLRENEYEYKGLGYMIWTEEKEGIFRRNVVDVLFAVGGIIEPFERMESI